METEFDGKPVYGDGDKYIKTKVKISDGGMITKFQSKNMPKEKAPSNCLSITMLDTAIKAKKNYYPQTLLEEYKYEQEKIKMESLIDNSEKSLSNEPESESDKW